jgi:hypothetical protein
MLPMNREDSRIPTQTHDPVASDLARIHRHGWQFALTMVPETSRRRVLIKPIGGSMLLSRMAENDSGDGDVAMMDVNVDADTTTTTDTTCDTRTS